MITVMTTERRSFTTPPGQRRRPSSRPWTAARPPAFIGHKPELERLRAEGLETAALSGLFIYYGKESTSRGAKDPCGLWRKRGQTPRARGSWTSGLVTTAMAYAHRQFFCSVLSLSLLLLAGCAANSSPATGTKVGLHIDAVLEFVIEYPLDWKKDRRLAYGSNEGDVRWKNPADKEVLLQVGSYLREHQDNEREIRRLLEGDPNLAIRLREEVTLPAGPAWYFSGQSLQQPVEIYLVLTPVRAYAIRFKSSDENRDSYDEVWAEAFNSFEVLRQ